MGTYVIPFNNRFPTPTMVKLSINEMKLVVRLILNKNVWHGIFELTYLVKIIHFLHVKRNFEARGGDGDAYDIDDDGGDGTEVELDGG